MEKQKRLFWNIVAISYSVVLIASIFIGLIYPTTTIAGIRWNWGLAMFLALVLYTIASFRKIGPTELGARLFFGRPIDQVSSGFVLVPFGIFSLEIAPAIFIQEELPSDPEHIFRGEGPIPEGKFPPIRIPFGLPTEENDDPYDHRMTQEVVPFITWRIVDFVKFLTTIGSVKDAKKQMEDTAVAMLTEAFAKITPAIALKEMEAHSQKLNESINKIVNGWGVELKSARIKAINFNHELNTAILGIPQATVKAKAEIITAEATKKKMILAGQGKGDAEKAELSGRSAGIKKMMEELNLPAHAILATETARAITNNPGQKTIIAGSGGFNDLATVGTVLGETLKTGKEGL